MDVNREKALDLAVSQIERQFGKGAAATHRACLPDALSLLVPSAAAETGGAPRRHALRGAPAQLGSDLMLGPAWVAGSDNVYHQGSSIRRTALPSPLDAVFDASRPPFPRREGSAHHPGAEEPQSCDKLPESGRLRIFDAIVTIKPAWEGQ